VRSRRPCGFSLVELLLAIFVGSIVLTAATMFFTQQVHAMRNARVRRSAQMTARTTLNLMVRQLELLGRDPQRVLFSSLDTPALPPAIAAADATSIHYRTNLSEALTDVDFADEWEDVTFSLDDNTIWVTRGANDPLPLTDGSKTASHVPDDGLELQYFDGDGDEIPNLTTPGARASVRRIRVTVTVNGGPVAADGAAPSITLSQDVLLRNVS
jgi:prepilin-type N-terminal cleavage/methylation domain-containing protein